MRYRVMIEQDENGFFVTDRPVLSCRRSARRACVPTTRHVDGLTRPPSEEMTHVQHAGRCPWDARPGVAAAAQVTPFPSDFRTQEITTDDGATIRIRAGGQGPAVVLLHGFGDTGDMWAPLAAELARDHTVVVPDLRGIGRSSHPAAAMTSVRKRPTSGPSFARLAWIGKDKIVGHELGTMVAYAYAARSPNQTEKLVVMDAPIPGIPPWDELVRHPLLWHVSFGGPDAERLVAGRERHVSRPLLEQGSRRPREDRRGHAGPLCAALCSAGCDALRLRPVPGLPERCQRREGVDRGPS